MATKEDILEQIVEEYLIMKGYFVQHNIKYRPDKSGPDYVSKLDSVHSDIDILAVNPTMKGKSRVLAVNCKSWQGGFQPLNEIQEFEMPKTKNRARWKSYRELTNPKWSDAFSLKIRRLTGSHIFTHVTAVTKVKPRNGNPVRVLTLIEMINAFNVIFGQTPASSEVGRLIQVLRAAGAWSENLLKIANSIKLKSTNPTIGYKLKDPTCSM